jgi:protein-disulfide isomerase
MRTKMVVLLFCFALSLSFYAQAQSNPIDQPQGDMSALRTDVTAIQAEQRQIITRLDELKQLLQTSGHPAAGPQPSPPPPPSTLDIRGEAFAGNIAAHVAIIEYSDFECPYCGLFERETSPQIVDNFIKPGKVKLFFRDLPLPMHPHAMSAANAARCAGDQGKFWEMHDSIFAKQAALSDPALLDRAKTLGLDETKFNECLSSGKAADDIRKSVTEAQRLGIQGTPTFFLGTISPDGGVVSIGKIIFGAHPYEEFKSALDELLASKNSEEVSTH